MLMEKKQYSNSQIGGSFPDSDKPSYVGDFVSMLQ
jgi:hypothetical protein